LTAAVGWVERSETHHGHFGAATVHDGFRFAQPIVLRLLGGDLIDYFDPPSEDDGGESRVGGLRAFGRAKLEQQAAIANPLPAGEPHERLASAQPVGNP
jgi:hypothetical protein